jgi:hypothetical protein
LTPQAFMSNGYNIYTSSLANNHEFGTAFLVDSKFNHMVKNFTPINERLCVIRIKGRFFNYSLINIHEHTPTNDSGEEAKDQFYEQLVDFDAGRQMAIKSTYFMHKRIPLQTWHSPDGHNFNQIYHFSDVTDVMARRDANIDSDHMLVVIKLRARICRASNTKPQQLRRLAVDRLKDKDVASGWCAASTTKLG